MARLNMPKAASTLALPNQRPSGPALCCRASLRASSRVSPEQLGAFGGEVDGRSDIYSIALVTAAASRGAVLPMGASIVDAVGKRASVPDLAGVAPELMPLLSWMLQPDPAQRVESMAKVMAAVDDPSLCRCPTRGAPRARSKPDRGGRGAATA